MRQKVKDLSVMISRHKPSTPRPLGPSNPVASEPYITVGIIDGRTDIAVRLNGSFAMDQFGPLSGQFSAHAKKGMIILTDENLRETACPPWVRLVAQNGSTFMLFAVTIGSRFHWERNEDQTFEGNLILKLRGDGMIAAINEIPLEDYLKSVISSEMSAAAPMEFLKTHATLSRSWLLAALERRKKTEEASTSRTIPAEKEGEVIRWYDREEHDLFDVCADDHCQRYQGITKISSGQAVDAVSETRGVVMTYQGEVCDARYSKACGGLTEDFGTAWGNERVPYLVTVSDASVLRDPVKTEEEAASWILSAPEAYCNTRDDHLLKRLLPEFDRETTSFFRWTVEYPREELEEILREKSGLDFGTLQEIVPLSRGSSGRISRLKIVGSTRSMIVGKELEIRRWLSRSHLYSSAFIVTVTYNDDGTVQRFTFHGAGWGHGVGLCQIGAAVMATRGFRAEEILKHYFPGVELRKIY